MAPVQGSKCIKWTVDEHAFVLNFTDYCLYHEQDYQKEIILELPKLTNGGRTATLGTVLKRVMLILKNDCKIKRPKINDFIKQGTSYLPLDKLPKAWVARMEEQRREWKIPQFKEPLSKDKHNHTKHPNARGRRCKSPNLQGGAKVSDVAIRDFLPLIFGRTPSKFARPHRLFRKANTKTIHSTNTFRPT